MDTILLLIAQVTYILIKMKEELLKYIEELKIKKENYDLRMRECAVKMDLNGSAMAMIQKHVYNNVIQKLNTILGNSNNVIEPPTKL